MTIIECNCNRPCIEVMYELKASYASFPSSRTNDYYLEQLDKRVGKSLLREKLREKRSSLRLEDLQDPGDKWPTNKNPFANPNKNETSELTKNNLISLDIFYERIGYYRHYQIEAVPSSSLVSDIGGQVGLWLGISIISIYEILQVCVIHIYRCGGVQLNFFNIW